MRVVEVWLDDEFKEHNCKSFKWFMENVAYEVYEKFPPLPPNKAWGEVCIYILLFFGHILYSW